MSKQAKHGWVFSAYDDPHVKPSHCHPMYHATRVAYVFEAHGARATRIEKGGNMHIDYGGMISRNDPFIEIRLSPHRTFTCWAHQASEVLGRVEDAPSFKHGRITFHRLARWPGVICFISATDRGKILRRLAPLVSQNSEYNHAQRMHEALIQANVLRGL